MDEKLLLSRLEDISSRAEKTNKPQFIGFLSEGENATAKKFLEKRGLFVSFFGGYKEALRNFVCVSPFSCDDGAFPLTAITFSFRKEDKLSHRDFLGSITALGIAREKIGDILIEDGRAVIFVDRAIDDFIMSQMQKVGRVGVNLKTGAEFPLPETQKKAEFSDTVASARLDCVVAALCNTSRNGANELIAESGVCVNSFLCEKPTQNVKSGDIISVRKNGRFNIVSLNGISKKGRIILKYEKYI